MDGKGGALYMGDPILKFSKKARKHSRDFWEVIRATEHQEVKGTWRCLRLDKNFGTPRPGNPASGRCRTWAIGWSGGIGTFVCTCCPHPKQKCETINLQSTSKDRRTGYWSGTPSQDKGWPREILPEELPTLRRDFTVAPWGEHQRSVPELGRNRTREHCAGRLDLWELRLSERRPVLKTEGKNRVVRSSFLTNSTVYFCRGLIKSKTVKSEEATPMLYM